jgi:hypothetical protein
VGGFRVLRSLRCHSIAFRSLPDLGIWNLGFGIWYLEFGTWNLEFGTWNLGFGTFEPLNPLNP